MISVDNKSGWNFLWDILQVLNGDQATQSELSTERVIAYLGTYKHTGRIGRTCLGRQFDQVRISTEPKPRLRINRTLNYIDKMSIEVLFIIIGIQAVTLIVFLVFLYLCCRQAKKGMHVRKKPSSLKLALSSYSKWTKRESLRASARRLDADTHPRARFSVRREVARADIATVLRLDSYSPRVIGPSLPAIHEVPHVHVKADVHVADDRPGEEDAVGMVRSECEVEVHPAP